MNIFALFSLFASVVSIYLGNFVYHLDKKKLLNKIFMFFSFSLSSWAFTEFMYRQADNPDTAYLWIKIGSLWPFVFSFFIHFALVFTEREKLLENKLAYFLIYVPAAIFFIIELTTNLITAGPAKKFWGYTYAIQEGSWVFWISQIWTFGLAFLAFFLCVGYYFKSTNKERKQQAKYVSIGLSIPLFAGFLTEGLVPLLQLEIPGLSVTFTTVLGIFLGYAIWKYELFTLSPATAAENIISTIPDSLILTDSEGKTLTVNQALLNLLGYKESELVGKSADTLFAEERFTREMLRKLSKDGVLKNCETKWKTKAGEDIQVSFSGSVVRSKEGQNVGIVGVIRDITERKQMEKKLRQYSEHLEELVQKRTQELSDSERRYSLLVEQASDGIGISQDAKAVFVNKKLSEMLGYSKDELIGRPILELIHEKYRQLTKETYEKAQEERSPAVRYFETKFVAKNGTSIPVELSTSRINYENANANMMIVRDISERKRLEEEHLRLERLAALGEVATMVGHDLRNPLQAITNATYYLNNKLPFLFPSTPIPQEAKEMLQVISDSINYADKIINDLQDFSKVKPVTLEKTDINTLVEETLSQVEAAENVELRTELDHLPEINVDKNQIKRVFLNLVTNGLQAMENGGTLTISTKKTDGFVEVSFKDTGVGIPEENMEKLFTPLFTTKAKGMGLGLPICKKFVELHGGNIEVKSQVDNGTTFTVKLPIQREMEVTTIASE